MLRPSNEEIKRSLQTAYERIENDYCEFICHGLEGTPAEYWLKNFIHAAMGVDKDADPIETLDAWVLETTGSWPKRPDMKAYRLHWIKYMLEGL